MVRAISLWRRLDFYSRSQPWLWVWVMVCSSIGSTSIAQDKAGTSTPESSSEVAASDWKPLFDGKTLGGWEGNEQYFRVEEQAIVAGTLKEKIAHNQFLCTEQEYSDFELRLEVKLRGEGNNAGIQFRSSRVPDSHEVSGYQCDVGAAWDRPVWGALYDESRRRKMLAEGPKEQLIEWLKEGDWNELRVVAKGSRIRLFLNGHLTVDYIEKEPEIAKSGIIGLQIHSGPPTEALYRKIQIRPL